MHEPSHSPSLCMIIQGSSRSMVAASASSTYTLYLRNPSGVMWGWSSCAERGLCPCAFAHLCSLSASFFSTARLKRAASRSAAGDVPRGE